MNPLPTPWKSYLIDPIPPMPVDPTKPPSEAYPIGCFDTDVFNAIVEVWGHVKCPDALVAMSFLTAMSTACQSLVDVKLPTQQFRPVSLNLLTIAKSGERKSAVDAIVCKEIHDLDGTAETEFEAESARFEAAQAVWEAEYEGLRRKLIVATKRSVE